MTKRHYHISYSGGGKSSNPLTKLIACILALIAIPVIFVAFTGVLALLLAAFVIIGTSAAVFFKFLSPKINDPNIIDGMEYNVVDEQDTETSDLRQDLDTNNSARRKPVVIEHDGDA